MFSFDETLHCIDAAESEVVALYRSIEAVVVAPPGLPPLSCEAFVCYVATNVASRAYVALKGTSARIPLFIYRPTNSSAGTGSRKDIVQALKFAARMGFTMEETDLNYGRALREVIIRSTSIFSLKPLSNIPDSGTQTNDVSESCSEHELMLIPLDMENEEDQSELELLLAEKIAAEKRAAAQEKEALSMLAASEERRRQRDQLLMEKAEAERRELEQIEAVRQARELITAEVNENDKILAQKLAAEQRANEQQKVAREAVEQMEASRIKRGILLQEMAQAEKLVEQQAKDKTQARAKSDAEGALAQKALTDEQAELDKHEKHKAEKLAREQHLKAAENLVKQAEKTQVARAECEALLAKQLKAEQEAAEQARILSKNLAALTAERAEQAKLQATTAASLEQQAQEIKSAQGVLEKSVRERTEYEKNLDALELSGKKALEELDAARLKYEAVEARCTKARAGLPLKLSAVVQAEKSLEAKGLAWEQAENSRLHCEKVLLGQAEAEKGFAAQLESARILLEKIVAERVEREKLTAELAQADMKAQDELNALQELMEAEEDITAEVPETDNSAEEKTEIEWEETPTTKDDKRKTTGVHEESSSEKLEVKDYAKNLAEVARQSFTTPQSSIQKQPNLTANPPPSISSVIPESSPFFSQAAQSTTLSFSTDYSLEAIEFHEENDILAVHQSLNAVRLNTEGFPSQNCTACVCAVAGRSGILTYFALHLAESDRNVIYMPDRQPGPNEPISQFIEQGIQFAETVGFLMDGTGLNPGELGKALLKPPFRRRG